MDLKILQHPSPNFGPRRDGAIPSLVVLHYTAMTCATAARDWLCNPKAEVSAHYLIARDGAIWQMVDETQRAWHAGAGAWGTIADVNSNSIGIELDNAGSHPFSAPLMQSLEALLNNILRRHEIPPQNVIAHSDLAPGRKIDPGPRFDWARLARQGLAIAPTETNAEQVDLDAELRRVGYSADAPLETRLVAFRLRHRPSAAGPADQADLRILSGLPTCT